MHVAYRLELLAKFDGWTTLKQREITRRIEQPNISRAIRRLREANLVRVRRSEAHGWYSSYRLVVQAGGMKRNGRPRVSRLDDAADE
jgi:hypothetical protein